MVVLILFAFAFFEFCFFVDKSVLRVSQKAHIVVCRIVCEFRQKRVSDWFTYFREEMFLLNVRFCRFGKNIVLAFICREHRFFCFLLDYIRKLMGLSQKIVLFAFKSPKKISTLSPLIALCNLLSIYHHWL